MNKMFKVLAMILVIAAVVYSAGCSSKAPENKSSVATEGVSEHNAAVNATENVTGNATEEVTENATENVTGNVTENETGNMTK